MDDELTTSTFWRAAGLRAARSFAQGVLTLAGADAAGLLTAGWLQVLVAAAGLAVASVLTSVAFGMPEAPVEATGREDPYP